MLRRVSTSLLLSQQGTRARLAAAAATSALSQRSCATYTNTSSNNRNYYNNNNNNRVQRNFNNNNNNNRRQPRVRPPAFDIVHWNDADVSAGHLLRVMHRDGLIVLLYLRQQTRIRADANASAEADVDAEEGDDVEEAGETSPQQQQQRQQQGRGGHAKLEVSVPLSPIYIARLLGVLEGRAERVEIQTRFNNATFAKKPGTAEKEKTFVLTCSSRRRASGQEEGEEGKDVADETFDWTVELDAAESLMLQRFLSQALQYHVGFGARA